MREVLGVLAGEAGQEPAEVESVQEQSHHDLFLWRQGSNHAVSKRPQLCQAPMRAVRPGGPVHG